MLSAEARTALITPTSQAKIDAPMSNINDVKAPGLMSLCCILQTHLANRN